MNPGLSDAMPPLASPFATTHWSVVLCAGRSGNAAAEEALEKLCRLYWPPLYAYVRRSGHTPEDSQDLTQSFFERLLSDGRLGTADPRRGRFRTFLLCSLKHFLVNEWRRSQRLKRGSGKVHLSFDCSPEEALFAREPACHETPEVLYDRRWALRILEQAMDALRNDYQRCGQGRLFDEIQSAILGEPCGSSYQVIAERLNSSVGAIKVAVFRLRQRFRERIREAVAATLPDPSNAQELESEIQYLQEVLKRPTARTA